MKRLLLSLAVMLSVAVTAQTTYNVSGSAYLGDVLPLDNSIEQQYMPDDNEKKLPVVKFEFELKQPVESALYKYFQD